MRPQSASGGVSERAMRVYRDAIVVDMHNDMPTKMLDDGYDPACRHTPAEGHTDLPRLIDSGITAQFLAAWVDAPYARATPDASYARAIRYIEAIQELVDRHPDTLCLATTAAQVRRAKQDGKIAILIGVEGGHAIEESLDKLRELHRRGARYLTLTWNNGNPWAGSSIGVDDTRTGGLTAFGKEVIRELDRLGMLVDLSHTSDQTFADAIAVSTRPVIASHSSARALSDHPRNLTDDQLRAIARTGGVTCVNFYPRFLETRFRNAVEDVETRLVARGGAGPASASSASDSASALAAQRRALVAGIPRTPFSILIDHIDHIANVAGVDHVGLGSDFDGITEAPAGMDDVTAFPRIAEALLDRGYAATEVQKILGGNMMRVMEQVLDPERRDREGAAPRPAGGESLEAV
jgi:membrane dipeptidase